MATYDALQQNLYVASKSLYGGGPSNSCGSYSCLWPFTKAAAGTVYLYGTPKGASYLSNVAARQTGPGRYADPSEVSAGLSMKVIGGHSLPAPCPSPRIHGACRRRVRGLGVSRYAGK